MTLRLTKHHGLGNDFLVALASRNPQLTPDPDVAVALCDRRRGIGADGLLWGLPPERGGADLRMVLHNADGSEAEISGNGIRCLGQAWAMDTGMVAGHIEVDTPAGRRVLDLGPSEDPRTCQVQVDMGEVTAGPQPTGPLPDQIGRHETFTIGNPHLVFDVPSLEGIDITSVGPATEATFPGGINVHALEAVDTDRIRLLHWERGAGATLACGSGASVAAVAARRWGLVDPRVERIAVELPGGVATVEVADTVLLRGPATYVGEVIVP
jgi:diaminopimelate epimerase